MNDGAEGFFLSNFISKKNLYGIKNNIALIKLNNYTLWKDSF